MAVATKPKPKPKPASPLAVSPLGTPFHMTIPNIGTIAGLAGETTGGDQVGSGLAYGTDGSGGGSTPAPTDWVNSFWGSLGLDQATINGLTKTLAGITDATQAQLLGENYLRQSTWFKNTFPGFDQGVQAGLFTDETGYRDYVNQLNASTQQYLGRAVSSGEVVTALGQGRNPALYANYLQGSALAQTLGPEAQYEAGAFTQQGRLTQPELQAYGNEQAGIDTGLGQQVQQRLQAAAQRMQTIFQGTLASPNLSLGPQGVFAPGLQTAQQGRGTPDTGA